MKSFYMVNEGEVTLIDDCETLTQYPFVCDPDAHEEEEVGSESWNLYETGGKNWVIAYAENEEDALALAIEFGEGRRDMDNVYCGNIAVGAVSR